MSADLSSAELLARAAAGEPVEPTDLAVAEARERLAAVEAARTARLEADAELERQAAERERLLDAFALEADALNKRTVAAVEAFSQAVLDVTVCRDDLSRLIARYLDALRPLGVVLDRSSIDVQTGFRVLLSADQLDRTTATVPIGPGYVRWLTAAQTERSAREEG